jgi:hypothetical protein
VRCCYVMHLWLELISRELFFATLLTALGAGPVAFLPERFDATSRFALAPTFGLCAGACAAVTVAYPFPTEDTGWFVIVLAVVSASLAIWKMRRLPRRPGAGSVIQVSVVVVVVVSSFNYPLALRHTVGPDGGYAIADTTGYVSETNGIQHRSIHEANRAHGPPTDLAMGYWVGYAARYQQLDVSALEANANVVLGLGSTDTHSSFLIVIVLVGALGVFAVVRTGSGRPTWAAALAGCLFAGPLYAELFMDGSQGAIAGSAVLPGTILVGVEALRGRRTATLILFALLVAGLQTLYPLFLPPLVLATAAAIAVVVFRRLRHGRRPARQEWIRGAAQLGGVIALAAAFTPIAFERNARYWIGLLDGSFSLAGLPAYVLPVNVLPGWVLQTREFYNLVDLGNATTAQFLGGAVVPLVLIAVIGFAVARYRVALALLGVAAGASLIAYYTFSSRGCTYCVQRNLIPIGTLAPAAIGLGVAGLASLRSRAGALAAVLVSAMVIAVVGHYGIVERQRLANFSYLLDDQNRQVLSALPRRGGSVELEGFGQGALPPMELPLVYNLLDERTHGHLSLATLTDDGRGLLYLGGTQPLGKFFNPSYRYVLTRLAGIRTERRVIARAGPIALEQRVQDLDVTITGGVSVAAARQDPTGTAWISGKPLNFLVVGGRQGAPAWVSLLLQRSVPVRVLRSPGVAAARERGDMLQLCVRAAGSPPVRGATVQLEFTPQAPPPARERYAPGLPPRGVRLLSMAVSATSCTR